MSEESVPCTAPKIHTFMFFTRIKLDQEWHIATISGRVLSSPHCPPLKVFKSNYAVLCVIFPCNHFPTGKTLLASHYSIRITMVNSLVPPVQTFTAKIDHTTYTASNHPQSFHIPLVRRNFNSNSFFRTVCI